MLIAGPRGTGKDVLAKLIHAAGPRKDKPCPSPVNCPQLAGNLLSSELFGCEKGAFTGAEDRQGIIREASGGTAVLDEIAVIPRGEQAKLLTFLQEKVVQPLGGAAVRVDVRVIATTNGNIDDEHIFQPDLRDRFQLVRLIALADKDPTIVCMLLQEHMRANNQLTEIGVRWLLKLMWHSWPGNVRGIESYCKGLAGLAEYSDDSRIRGTTVLDEYISTVAGLVPVPRGTTGGGIASDPTLVARGLLYLCQLYPIGFGGIDPSRLREIANSLKLLAYLALDNQQAKVPTFHPDTAPLRRLEQPECFPRCYDISLGHADAEQGECLNLIQFLSAIVRLSRLKDKAYCDECVRVFGRAVLPCSALPDAKWLAWIAGLPDSLPDYLAMDGTAEPRVDVAPASPAATVPAVVQRCRTQSKPGPKQGRISDQELVNILQRASEVYSNKRFPPGSRDSPDDLWRKLGSAARGRDSYGTRKSLSQRIRRIKNDSLRDTALLHFKKVFVSIG